MTRLERRERERAERRQAIVTGARELAEADGWEAVTTRRLSDRIEYSQPVLYSHFENRDAIIEAVALEGFSELWVVMHHGKSKARTPVRTARRLPRPSASTNPSVLGKGEVREQVQNAPIAVGLEPQARFLPETAVIDWNLPDPLGQITGLADHVTEEATNFVFRQAGEPLGRTRVGKIDGLPARVDEFVRSNVHQPQDPEFEVQIRLKVCQLDVALVVDDCHRYCPSFSPRQARVAFVL
jgi:AcrR family transcriptional regulator